MIEDVTERAPEDSCDVLVVGAGPTGWRWPPSCRRTAPPSASSGPLDRARESRALTVQPRTLEVLRSVGVSAELIARGNPAVQLRLHAGSWVAHARLFDIGLDDTAFRGGPYPQTFLLADLDVDGLQHGTVNAFVTDQGPLSFFPLAHPAPWRLITMRPDVGPVDEAASVSTAPTSLAELQALTERATGGRLRLRDPVWATAFRLHHRSAVSGGCSWPGTPPTSTAPRAHRA
jgi:2-polyprenyl-6-methoxyphenol hydroxylase-like FAD-dependent oxidoreductase